MNDVSKNNAIYSKCFEGRSNRSTHISDLIQWRGHWGMRKQETICMSCLSKVNFNSKYKWQLSCCSNGIFAATWRRYSPKQSFVCGRSVHRGKEVSSLWKVFLSHPDNLHFHPVDKSGQCHSSYHGLHTGIYSPKAERVNK